MGARLRTPYVTGGHYQHLQRMLVDDYINALYHAVIEATEEAILNAMPAAKTITGRGGATVHALEPAVLTEIPPELGRPRG